MISYSQVSVDVESGTGTHRLLDDVSVELTAPTIAVIGENGSGKSTFAKVLAGLLKYQSGSVQVNGFEVSKSSKELRKRVGMIIPNAAAQVIMPTVEEDVALTLRGSGLSKEEQRARVAAALETHELTELADRPALSLSSGQLQRLALCSVLIGEPEILIADEPTSMLDARHQHIVASRLFSLPESTQLVLVTHDMDLAARCDEAIWIDNGRLRAHGQPRDLIDQYLRFLGIR